ncbi:hypothetical protein QQ045_004708 [Rhodiola kirilowii]
MAMSLKGGSFVQLKKLHVPNPLQLPARPDVVSTRSVRPVAALSTTTALGISDTFAKLKEKGKCSRNRAEALKILDKSGSDIIELGVPYSDPLADGPVIQAVTTRALAKGVNLDAILNMLKTVVPELSCPVSLFSYYNLILKRGIGNFMATIKSVGIQGLVVPDVPLEETEALRKEAVKHNIELVLLTTPTTPKERMHAIADAAEGFIYLFTNVRRQTTLRITGFTQGTFPTTYLGAPLFPGRVKVEYFQALEDKVRNRINGWVKNLLSMGGKITIIEAILNSLITHILAALPKPVTVIKRISRLFACFLWDSNSQKRQHWVSWDNIFRPKDAGGLGIRNLEDIKTCLQNKLAWRCMESTQLWGRYMRSRHPSSQGSHTWTVIKKLLPNLKSQAKWIIGVAKISCLDFCWLYDVKPPDDLKWLPLHAILTNEERHEALLEILSDRGKSDLHQIIMSDKPDQLFWMRSVDGKLNPKNYCLCLTSPKAIHPKLSRIWYHRLPPRISVFLWKLFHGALATDDCIQKCGIPISSKCRCCTHPKSENIHHVFVESETAQLVWSHGLKLLNIRLLGFLNHIWFTWFQERSCSTLMDAIRTLWAACGLWEIWKFRNHVMHDRPAHGIIQKVVHWVRTYAVHIRLPYNPTGHDSLIIKTLGISPPYTPRRKWRKWMPNPIGTTLN